MKIPFAGMIFLFCAAAAHAATHYVDLNSTNAAPPFTDWTTAATNIQDAIDAAVDGDLVLVTNGVYQTGGRLTSDGITNRIIVTNAVTLRSVNGWPTTTIDGGHAMRCAYLAEGAALSGFAITNGNVVGQPGGGVYCVSSNALVLNSLVVSNSSAYGGGIVNGSVSNCIISFNHSSSSGGGAESCWLYNCILSNNFAGGRGGGASAGTFSTMNNCIVIGNSATSHGGGIYGYAFVNNCLIESNRCLPSGFGGGTSDCVLNNCTVVGNSASLNGGVELASGGLPFNPAAKNCIVYYNFLGNVAVPATNCCTIPLPAGTGNFTNAPIFVNLSAGDFHLQSNSPCVNSGAGSIRVSTDLDGNPRVVGGAIDLGAYECQTPGLTISYLFAQSYGISTDGSLDTDGDGLNNYSEWIAGTNPTNAASLLALNSPSTNSTGLNIIWQSVSGKTYFLQRATNLLAQPAFSSLASNITGTASATTYPDTTATNIGPYFYRVGVQ